MSGSALLQKGATGGGGKEARARRSRPVLALGLLAALGVLVLVVVASLALGSGNVPFRVRTTGPYARPRTYDSAPRTRAARRAGRRRGHFRVSGQAEV
ncbi:hypothetical protein ACFWST_17865, partial [Streptomyces cyaneofuscatus]